MSKLSFQSVMENVLAFLIAGTLGVLYSYFVSGSSSNAVLMRSFMETAFVFFLAVRSGMVMAHFDGGFECINVPLTLALLTIIAMAVCGFIGIGKKTLVFVFAVLDVIFAFALSFGYADVSDSSEHVQDKAYRKSSDNTNREHERRSSDAEESFRRYAGFEYEDDHNEENESYGSQSNAGSESAKENQAQDDDYDDEDSWFGNKWDHYEEPDDDEDEEQKSSQNESNNSDSNSSNSYSGSYSSRSETEVDRALRVFGVRLPITSAELKKRRNQLVKENHPDHGGTNEKMVEINKAYDLLKRFAS